jgi:hypothetical protein
MNPRAVAAFTAALLLAPIGLSAPAHAAGVFTVYVAPNGDDVANNGRSATSPMATLEGAQEIVRSAKPRTDVEIRIKPGTYVSDPKTIWTTYVPGHFISFLPVGYTFANHGRGVARPVFANKGEPGHRPDGNWLQAQSGPGLDSTGAARLRFFHLEVRGFQGGISFDGGTKRVQVAGQQRKEYKKQGGGLNDNTVQGMAFRQIGNKDTGGKFGYGALILTNSSRNQIRDNTFTAVENNGAYGAKLHGTYVTHFSDANVIVHNTFTSISGDPVKLRDRSDNNQITGNTFTRAGHYSYYREEFCTGPCLVANPTKDLECPSGGNHFAGNTLRSGYRGRPLPDVSLAPKSNTDKGPAGCPDLPEGVRVTAAGNKG